MKRDMELIRKILITIEDSDTTLQDIPLNFEEYSDEQISYHVKILHEQGLIDAIDATTSDGIDWIARGLTWDGHDYIEAIKDENRWQRVKAWVKNSGKILTIETAKQAIQQLFL
jgi:predicted transcriptional regulator